MNEKDDAHNPPMEFRILEVKSAGFIGTAWFHGENRLGSDPELESILNRLGGEGWDIVQMLPNGYGGSGSPRILLRRRAR